MTAQPFDQDAKPDAWSCLECAHPRWDVASRTDRHCSRCGWWSPIAGTRSAMTQQQKDQDHGRAEDPIEVTRQVSGSTTEPGQPGQPEQPGQPGQPETDAERRERQRREEEQRRQER